MKSAANFLVEDQINPSTYNLSKLYSELNAMLFGNELPKHLPIGFKKLPKRLVGMTTANRTRGGTFISVMVPGSLRIDIDTREFNEDVLKGIVAHEMIHAWLLLKNDFKTQHDGPYLIKLGEIQHKAPFKISLKHETSVEEYATIADKETAAIIVQKPDGHISVGLFSLNSLEGGVHDVKRFAAACVRDKIQPHLTRVRYGVLKSKLHIHMPIQRAFNINKIKVYSITDLSFIQDFKAIVDIKE